ncbi:DUF6745 domain-containing protein [Streptomyces sp. NPDC005811]|uniref:DUF6745 domain-containing protein n=1 Tax=Streptomyces sp. NPDC005811 TaxID=3154565 RepID=UPI0033C41892
MAYPGTLTDADAALITRTSEEWMTAARSTGRCDRPAAEDAVAASYAEAGLVPPRTVVWMDSPLGGALAAHAIRHGVPVGGLRRLVVGALPDALLDRVERRLVQQIPDRPDEPRDATDPDSTIDLAELTSQMFRAFYGLDRAREPLWGPLSEHLQSRLEAGLGGPLHDPFGVVEADEYLGVELWSEVLQRLGPLERQLADALGARVAGHLRGHLQRRLPDSVRRRLRAEVRDSWGVPPDPDAVMFRHRFGGWLDPWSGAYSFAAFSCALQIAGLEPSPRLDTLAAALRAVGWWWPMEDAVVLTDRPTELSFDRAGGLLLVEYADGYRVAV